MITVYRIFDPINVLYSDGGTYPRWSKKGKVWRSKSALSNHLSLVASCGRPAVRYSDQAIIVEFEVEETMIKTHTTAEWLAGMNTRRAKRNRS